VKETNSIVFSLAATWANDSLDELKALAQGDYSFSSYDHGVEIVSVPHDPLDMRLMNASSSSCANTTRAGRAKRGYNLATTRRTAVTFR
jgi:hypothetical protein